MNKLYPLTREQRNLEFAIEDFFSYTPKRQIALLEVISQVLLYADASAKRGFGREAQAGDYDRVTEIEHSAWWWAEYGGFSMSEGILQIIRNHLESVGYLRKDCEGWGMAAKWDRKAKGMRTRMTKLKDLNVRGMALLARRMMCHLIDRIGWDALTVSHPHNWGGLAAIVRRITGLSLFSMDEEQQEQATPQQRAAKRALEFDRLLTELNNAIGIDGYYEDVLAAMVRRFGVEWKAHCLAASGVSHE